MLHNIEPIEHPIDPRLVTLSEAAYLLGLSAVTVGHRIEQGLLTRYVIGPKCHLVDRREVEALKAAAAK